MQVEQLLKAYHRRAAASLHIEISNLEQEMLSSNRTTAEETITTTNNRVAKLKQHLDKKKRQKLKSLRDNNPKTNRRFNWRTTPDPPPPPCDDIPSSRTVVNIRSRTVTRRDKPTIERPELHTTATKG